MAKGDKKNQQIDWERIEPHWRLGIKSVLQISAEYEHETGRKVSHTAINKHFKKLGVPRDLSAKVRAKADALVSAATVSARVSVETTLADSAIINETAQAVAEVRIQHRRDITRAKDLALKLMEELDEQTEGRAIFAQLGDIMRAGEGKAIDRMNEIYHKVIGTPSRIDSMRKLAETLKNLISLEREAWGIASLDDDKSQKAGSVVLTLSPEEARI